MTRRLTLPRALTGTRKGLAALVIVVCLAVAAIVGVAAHGPSGDNRQPAASTPSPTAASGVVATRWWSVPGAVRGSHIDPQNPTAVAASLRPSRTAYCTVLKQTIRAGHALLPDVSGKDPVLTITAEAFIGELTALAPAPIQTAWQTTGAVVLALIASKGQLSTIKQFGAAGLAQATARIAADARNACHVNLASTSSVTTSPTKP